MLTTLDLRKRTSRRRAETTREARSLLPRHGIWTEDDYLDITTNQLVEFTDGLVEVLPMPTPFHQSVSTKLLLAIEAFIRPRKLGMVFHAPVPLWIGLRKYREPDLIFVTTAKLSKTWKRDRKLDQADLVVEVLSGGAKNRKRDMIQKKAEYADAGIPEYWIVDPVSEEVTVWKLRHGKYTLLGQFGADDELRSGVLAGFRVSVRDLF